MKKLLIMVFAVALMTQGAMAQQLAPTPRNAPRTPVDRASLMPSRKPMPPGTTLQGTATITDTDKLRIEDVDMRLFGIVPPQLSASFGPQARQVLDNLTVGQTVACAVRDREQNGRYLATCRNGSGTDLALELLRRGLAVSARGSLAGTELDATYLGAEQAAQTAKLGLWSVTVPAAATLIPKLDTPVKETAKSELPPLLPTPPAQMVVDVKPVKTESKAADEVQAKVSSSAPALNASTLAPPADETLAVPDGPGFFARYQLLITGFIMLVTALSILLVVSRQRNQEKRDEMKAIAAALRGELMAARAVCQARLKTLEKESEDKTSWPRIRSTLYQAYVGRLGFLGAELARQVASIYGQASDYAAYYNSDEEKNRDGAAPKKQALQALVQHIEEVLPKLAVIEQTGSNISGIPHMPPASGWHPVETVAHEKVPVTESATAQQFASPSPLWQSVRKFAQERFTKPAAAEQEDADYAALVEAEMAGMTFGEAEDDASKLSENVTKMRTGS